MLHMYTDDIKIYTPRYRRSISRIRDPEDAHACAGHVYAYTYTLPRPGSNGRPTISPERTVSRRAGMQRCGVASAREFKHSAARTYVAIVADRTVNSGRNLIWIDIDFYECATSKFFENYALRQNKTCTWMVSTNGTFVCFRCGKKRAGTYNTINIFVLKQSCRLRRGEEKRGEQGWIREINDGTDRQDHRQCSHLVCESSKAPVHIT